MTPHKVDVEVSSECEAGREGSKHMEMISRYPNSDEWKLGSV